jgi:hypothetical protein
VENVGAKLDIESGTKSKAEGKCSDYEKADDQDVETYFSPTT